MKSLDSWRMDEDTDGGGAELKRTRRQGHNLKDKRD